MKATETFHLSQVQQAYRGADGRFWELVMGEQIHIGGMESSADLAEKAEIRPGSSGIDLCCGSAGGMRFLVSIRGVEHMVGVDATDIMIARGQQMCDQSGLSDRISMVLRDASACGLPAESADFIWSEDAWCYVEEKSRIIREAARLVRPGGTIAFTDWTEGNEPMSGEEVGRLQRFMKFPSIATWADYSNLLARNGCEVLNVEETGRFEPCIDLYVEMIHHQFEYDLLRRTEFNAELANWFKSEMLFLQRLARANKLTQFLFVARKSG